MCINYMRSALSFAKVAFYVLETVCSQNQKAVRKENRGLEKKKLVRIYSRTSDKQLQMSTGEYDWLSQLDGLHCICSTPELTVCIEEQYSTLLKPFPPREDRSAKSDL